MDERLNRPVIGSTYTGEALKSGLRARWRRRIASATAGVLFAAGGTVVSLVIASPALAASIPMESMLVNDNYDNYDGQMWCLSANGQTSNNGTGTHFVYLAVCNPDAQGQWWWFTGVNPDAPFFLVTNMLDLGDNTSWELSANNTTPAGGDAGTYGAYTASSNYYLNTHYWTIYPSSGTNRNFLRNYETERDLSASANKPEIAGTMRVYTVGHSDIPPHVWRFYNAIY